MEQTLAIDPDEVLGCSAKTGVGCEEVLEAIIDRVPPPAGDPNATLQAMVFDSHYDEFRGAITYVRVMNGTVQQGPEDQVPASRDRRTKWSSWASSRRSARPADQLSAGQVGYLICNIKSLGHVHIGDTVSGSHGEPAKPLPGYQEPKRMVFCGLYPSDGQDFKQLREALDKLAINDPSFEFEPETSDALGLWLPLRVPGPAAHGDRPAAAGTGGRHRPGADRAERDVRDRLPRAARNSRSTLLSECPNRARSRSFASRSCG